MCQFQAHVLLYTWMRKAQYQNKEFELETDKQVPDGYIDQIEDGSQQPELTISCGRKKAKKPTMKFLFILLCFQSQM